MAHDRVANLVIRHHLLFIVLKDAALLLKTGHNTLDRFTEVLLLTLVRWARAASRAASFTRLARSAPAKPLVA